MNTAEWMLKSKPSQIMAEARRAKPQSMRLLRQVYTRSVSSSMGRTNWANQSVSFRFALKVKSQLRCTPRLLKRRCALAAQRRATTSSEHCRTVLCNQAAIDGRSIRTPKKLGVLAIKDRAPSVTSQMSKRPAAQKPAAQKPAAMKVIKTVKVKALKRPSAHGAPAAMKVSNTGMTEALKKKHDEEHEAQNDQLNKCLEKALSQLGAMEMKARKAQAQAKAAGGGSKLKEVHEQELGRVVSEIAILADRLKDVTILKTSSAFAPDKVDLLENSSKTIQEAKDIISVLTKTIAPKAASAGVSSESRG